MLFEKPRKAVKLFFRHLIFFSVEVGNIFLFCLFLHFGFFFAVSIFVLFGKFAVSALFDKVAYKFWSEEIVNIQALHVACRGKFFKVYISPFASHWVAVVVYITIAYAIVAKFCNVVIHTADKVMQPCRVVALVHLRHCCDCFKKCLHIVNLFCVCCFNL